MSETEGNMPFQTPGHHVRMIQSSQILEGFHHVRTARNRSPAVSKADPARSHRAAAGVREPARREGSPDLETDRTGAGRYRAGPDPNRDFCGLSATRCDLRTWRKRHR